MECNECNGTMTVAVYDTNNDMWVNEPCWGCVREERNQVEDMVIEMWLEQNLKRLINASSAESQVRYMMWIAENPEKIENVKSVIQLSKTFTQLMEMVR